MDMLLKSVQAGDAGRMMNKGFAEVVFRDGKGRIEAIKKIAVGMGGEGNAAGAAGAGGALGKLQIALQVANLAATIISAVIICNKLNKLDKKMDEIQRATADLKDFNFEMQIAHPCRELVGDYKLITDNLKKGKPVSRDEMVSLIRSCQNYLVSLYNLRGKIQMESALDMIFTLLPIYANCIMLYYQRWYDENEGKHALHDDWMAVFDLLLSKSLLNETQDDMIINQRKTNGETNEYLAYHKAVVQAYRSKIDQLIEDLNTCGGTEGYEEAMRWSRQYAAQQAKAIQNELEEEYGVEKAKGVMEQAMQEALI